MSMDLYKNVKVIQLLHDNHDGASVGTLTGTAQSISKYNKRVQIFAHAEWEAAGAADDTVSIAIQKCTASDGTGATTVGTISLTGPNNTAGCTDSDQIAIDLEGLGTTYTHLRAVATCTSDGSGQEVLVSTVLVAGWAANEVN